MTTKQDFPRTHSDTVKWVLGGNTEFTILTVLNHMLFQKFSLKVFYNFKLCQLFHIEIPDR